MEWPEVLTNSWLMWVLVVGVVTSVFGGLAVYFGAKSTEALEDSVQELKHMGARSAVEIRNLRAKQARSEVRLEDVKEREIRLENRVERLEAKERAREQRGA